MTKSVRVMHIVSKLSTYGAENLVAQLAEKLAERHVEVCVLTVYDSGPNKRGNVFRGPTFSARRRSRWDLAFFPRMVGVIRAWRPTIVHTHVHNGKYWGRLAAIAAGVPHIVHTEHNSDFRAGALERLSNRILHKASARIVAFSPAHAQALAAAEKLSSEKIAIIANGIARFEPGDRLRARRRLGIADGEKAIFTVGRLEPVKNQQLAIAALKHLPDTLLARTKLFVVGDGVDQVALRRIAHDAGVDERVIFLGYRNDVRVLLEGADALLVTSLNEAMPLSVIEAIVAGVPIVSTPWHGVEAMVNDRIGRIAAGWSAPEVASALCSVLEGGAPTEGFDRARTMARSSYDIALTAQRHIELYEALI